MRNRIMAPASSFAGEEPARAASSRPAAESMPWKVLVGYSLVLIAALLAITLPLAKDYVGTDNDDVMRLLEVRDLLAGQGWFDMHQYRLGLDGGTLMHWSRFIDMPIANLISFFSLFMGREQAEAVALTIWPPLLVVPVLYGIGLAGLRLGGRLAMHASLVLISVLILSMNKFLPGSIDHHNVQLALTAIMAAMLVDPHYRPKSLGIAGFSAGLAIAIGAETMPLIAAVCIAVSLLWAWNGVVYAPAARAFGLSLAATVTAAFFLTVPPSAYGQVTCDNLSLGFYAPTTIGGGLLFLAAAFCSGMGRTMRFASLAGVGALTGVSLMIIAPQCLQSPLAGLDPMLVTLWLDGIMEAQSAASSWRNDPQSFFTFYAVGPLALGVCLYRIVRREKTEAYVVLLGLMTVCYAVGLVQVRGTLIANFLAVIPLGAAIMDARRSANAQPGRIGPSLGFIVLTLASFPAVWSVGGLLVMIAKGQPVMDKLGKLVDTTEPGTDCTSRDAFRELALLPAGVVASSSDVGSHILRYTQHRALSAPYHRNQGGMLTELHIGLSNVTQAEAFIRGAGVTVVAFCASDGQAQRLAKLEPDGLYAHLLAGKVPAYLDLLPETANKGLKIFRVTGTF